MDNFVFNHPVKIVFGRDVLEQLGKELCAIGSNILFVYGKSSIKKSGLFNQITGQLDKAGISFTEFGNVGTNPRLSDARKGIEKARAAGCNGVLAVGGGSVIDTAKAIGAGAVVKHDVWKFFNGRKTVRATLPLVTVPTLAGSGSEINHAMVLTHDDLGYKFGFAHRLLYPRVCLADPSYTSTVSAKQTAYGTVDALCHAIEPYMTSQAENIQIQRRFLENICRSIVEAGPACLEKPDSYAHRAALLWSAMMAMSPMATAGLGRVYHTLHVLEHGISAGHDIAHGAGLAALLPGWLEFYKDSYGERIGQWGAQVFLIREKSAGRQSESTITELNRFLVSLGCAVSLSELGINQAELSQLAEHAAAQTSVREIPGIDRNQLLEILQRCW